MTCRGNRPAVFAAFLTSLLTLGGVLLTAALPAFAQSPTFWIGQGTSLDWSDAANWDSGVPGSGSVAWFEDSFYTGYTNAAGAVNNVVAPGSSVGAVVYNANSFSTSNHFFTTLIPDGVSLTLGGLGSTYPALCVGDVPVFGYWLNAGSLTNYTTITGAGRLTVNDSAGLMSVGQRNRATLDLTGLNTFNASIAQLLVGASPDNPYTTGPTGALLLGKTNNITTTPSLTAPGVLLGYATNGTGTAITELGRVNNFNTDGLVVGGRRAGSTFLRFGLANSNGAAPGNFTLRGSGGSTTPASVFSIGDAAANVDGYSTAFPGSTASATGTADFSGATVDIFADSIYVGRASAAAQVASGTGNGTLIVEQGTVTATNVYIAYKPPESTNASIGQGALVLRGNALMNVMKDVALVYRTNGTSFIGESRIAVSNNAVLNVGGNLTTTHTIGTWTPASVALDGGTVNMTGGGTVSIPTLLAHNSSIVGANMVTVTNSLALGRAAALFQPALPGTLLVGNNLTLGTNMPVSFKLGADTTVGGGVNDLLGVANNLTLNSNPITVTFTAPLVTGTYWLMTNGGAQSGSVTWANPTRSAAAVVQTATAVGIQVSSAAPADLVMAGTTNAANWGLTNVVWNNNTERFYQLDNVLFDDTATATNITLIGEVTPGSITVSNETKLFTFATSSPNGLAGFSPLTKDGAGVLFLNGVNNNFVGPVNIRKGSIKLGFANAGEQFGKVFTKNPITIYNGGALDTFNNYSGSGGGYGRPFIIAGTGVGGNGAIFSSHASSAGSITTAGVTLTDDATIRCGNLTASTALRQTLTGVSASYPYANIFDLGNHTLTLAGNEIRLSQFTMTNAGTINVNSASLSLQNCIIDGAGDLNLGNKNLNFNSWTAGYVAKPMIVNGGSITIASAGNPAVPILIGSAVTMNGGLTITNSQPIRFTNSLTGIGSLVKYGNSNLVLEAANTYSGQTLINAGTFSLGNAGSLANSPLIQINPGTILDVSAKAGTYTVAPGQTLNFNGTAVGDITAGANSTLLGAGVINGSLTLAAGNETALAGTNVTGTMIVSNNLTLSGGHLTWELAPSFDISDAIVVGGNLTLTGTNVFTINSIGGFDPSGVNTLITYSGSFNGGLTNLALNTPARFTIEFVDPATTPGVIQVRLINPSPTLVWKGGAAANPTRWDVKTTANWDKGGVPDIFYSSDLVTFDDTSATNVVDLAETLGPGAITMANNNVPYVFRGMGGLVAASLTNNGTAGLTISNSANNFFTGVGMVLNNGALTFQQPTNATLTGNLIGPGTFNKAGDNVLTLFGNAANFVGTANVNGGTLRAGNSNAIASAVNVGPGSTLDINGQSLPNATLTVSGIGADGWGAINNRGAGRTNALTSVTLAGNTTVGALSNAWGIVNNLQGAGYALTKTNAQDVWIMTGSETDLGNIDVRQGRLIFSGAGTTLGRPESNITVRANAALALATTNAMPQSGSPPDPFDAGSKLLILQANAAIETVGFPVNQTSTNIFRGPISITNSGVFRVGSNSRLELSGPISGENGLLVLTNGGTLALSGTNTYTSNTIVHSGTLLLTSSSNLPANTTLILSNRTTTGNAALLLGNNAVFPVGNPMNVSLHNAAVTIGGDGTWNGPITLSGGNNFGLYGGADGLNLLGTIITNGNAKVSIEGDKTRVAGSLKFTNEMGIGVSSGLGAVFNERFTTVQFDSQNYWTNTVFGRGRIILGASNALPPSAPMRLGVLSAGVGDRRLFLDLNGFNQTVTTVAETAVGDSLIRFGNSSTNGNSMLTVATPTGATNTWAIRLEDDLDNQLDYTNNLGLIVTSGLLVLVNTNTYTGPTLVSGGTLLLNLGSGITAGRVGQLGDTAVTVSGTGTLGGNGIIAGPVTIGAGGTLSAGTSIGRLTINNTLELQTGSRAVFEVNVGTTNDQVVGISTLTYGGTLVVTNVGAVPFADGNVFKLFDAANYVAGAVAVQPAFPGPGLAWDTSKLAADGTLRVVPLPPAPVIANYGTMPDGNFSITVNGVNGRQYSLLASTNVAAPISAWTLIKSDTQTGSSIVLTDLGATNHPTRFYLISTP